MSTVRGTSLAPSKWLAPLSRERGFTLIEVMVAMMIVLILVGGLTMMFTSGNNSALANQSEVSQLSILQNQIERIRQVVKQYGFTSLALTNAPAGPTDSPLPADPTNPNDFVSGTACSEAFTVESNYNNTAEAYPSGQVVADNPESLLINGCTVSGNAITGGQIVPVQYADLTTGTTYSTAGGVPAGDPYATVYTYVTQTSTAGCNSSLGSCTGDVRRVIVATVLSHTGSRKNIGPNAPTYSTTLFINPVASNQPNQASGLKILGLIP